MAALQALSEILSIEAARAAASPAMRLLDACLHDLGASAGDEPGSGSSSGSVIAGPGSTGAASALARLRRAFTGGALLAVCGTPKANRQHGNMLTQQLWFLCVCVCVCACA